MIFKEGGKVIVYPHGSPDQSAVGKVLLISGNQLAIAVGFDSMPPFAFARGPVGIHPEYGVVMMARRIELGGSPWGPWVEVPNGGHYEIEVMQ